MPNGIIDPFGQPTYMDPSVPAPSTGEIIDPFDKPISLAPGVPAPSTAAIIDPFEKRPSPLAGLQELLLPRVRPVVAEPSKPSLMGELGKGIMQGLYQTKEMGGGLMALGAEALRSASSTMEPITAPVKEFGIETMKAAEKSMEPYQGAVPSYRDIGGAKDALQYLSHGVGTLLPMIAMSIASGGVGAAAGKMLAKNYVKTLAERMALEGIPGEIINASVKQGLLRGIERGALLGGYASSLAMEAGSITADKVREGQDVEPLRVMLGAIPAAALDVLPQFSLAKRTGLLKRFGLSKAEAELAEEAVKKMPASFLGRVGKEAGTQFLQEAPTEAMQSVFENWAAHKDLTSQESIDDFIDSFLIGGAGGALFGGIGGAMQRKPSPQQPVVPGIPPILPPIIDPNAPPVITPAPTQAQPEPGVTPPPVTPPLVPTLPLAPPPAPSGPVIPLQPPPISTPVVENLPAAPQPPIAEPGKAGAAPAVPPSAETVLPPPLPTGAAPTPPTAPAGAAPAKIPEPIPWEGPEWTEPGREVTFTHPNTDRQVRGVIRDVVLGPPDGKTPVTITVSPKWRMDQTFDLPAAEVTEPAAVLRMKEYHAALEGLHPADRAQVRKNAKEFDRLLLANADLFVDRGEIDFFYEGATTPRKQAIASNQILNNARSEAGKELAIDDVFNPLRRAESLVKLRDRIERERPGTTAPIPEAPKPTPLPKPTTFQAPAPPKAETTRGPVAEPTAPAAAKEPWKMSLGEFQGTEVWTGEKYETGKTPAETLEWTSKAMEAMKKGHYEAAKNLPDGTEIQGWKKVTIAGDTFWQKGDKTISRIEGAVGFKKLHEAIVKQALSENKSIPPEVLEDYPNLAPKPTAAAPAPTPTPAPVPEETKRKREDIRHSVYTDTEVARRLTESTGHKVFMDAYTQDRYYWIDPNAPPMSIRNIKGSDQRTIPKEEVEKTRNQILDDIEAGTYIIVEPEEGNLEIVPAPTHVPEAPAKPEHRLAQRLSTELKDRMAGLIDSPITNTSLFNLAAIEFGGTRAEGKFTPRQAYDAMEMGVNKYLQENPDKATPEGLKKLESMLPTESIRTEDVKKFQQFSTPPRLAYATNWLANLNDRDVFTETSAGNGGLAVFADIAGVKAMVLNELDRGRVENLKFLFPKAEVFNENAEHISDIVGSKLKEKPTVAVINPPFSASGERMPGKKILDIVEKHIDQALQLLQPNGRLVVITGRGFTLEAPTFTEFWSRIKSQYNVLANVGVSGKTFSKYGTSFDIRITVIDKTGPTVAEIYDRYYNNTEELFGDPKLEEIRNGRKEIERRVAGERAPAQPPIEPGYQEPGGKPGAGGPVLAPTGTALPGPGGVIAPAPAIPPSPGRPEATIPEATTGIPGSVPGRRGEVPTGRPGEPGPVKLGVADIGTTGIAGIVPERGIPETVGGPTAVTVPEKTELKDNKLYEDARYPKQDMGGAHPTKLVEPVALVDIDPPSIDNITLNLKPENLKGNEKGKISSDQIYITKLVKRAHGKGMAFFNAGGTGSGKGLANAAAIMDLWNSGKKKAIWMSQSKELRKDAIRDWKMLGGRDEDIVELSKIKNNQTVAEYLKSKQMPNQGILFFSYNLLAMPEGKKEGAKKRIDQVLEWLGPAFDGAVIFDESHNMANAIPTQGRFGKKKPSQKALTGIDFQDQIPNAKVIYSSATGATQLENLAYAQGLKVWGEGTSFADVYDFLGKVSPHGTAGLEMVAADLKRKGIYMAPSISFEGVTQEKLTHAMTTDQTEMYNEVAKTWQKVLHNINDVMVTTGANLNSGARRNASGIFQGAQQRFFQQMLLSMQMPTVVQHVKEQIALGYSPVIQLVNTNEASQERAFARKTEEQELEELDLTPRDILMSYLETSFPIGKYEEYLDDKGNVRSRPVLDSQGNRVPDPAAVAVRDNLLAELGAMKFPDNPLDFLIHELGHEKIAEVTGRGRRLVYKDGKLAEEARSDLIIQGEVQDFYDDKRIGLVFSQKGNTGFSYDSDKSFINQRKRIHYLVQAGWRADQLFQGLGRSHRANEATPPHIVRASIDVPAAQRFDATIGRRLEELGAISRGQRQTTSQGLFSARENLENTQGNDSLQIFYRNLYNGSVEGITIAEFADQTGLRLLDQDGGLLDQLPPIQQFLNRLLVLELHVQRAVFSHFSNILDIEIEQAEKSGRLDLGLRNLHALRVDVVSDKVVHVDTETSAKTNLMHIESIHEAPIFTYRQFTGWANEVLRNVRSGKIWAVGKTFNRTNADGSIERVTPLRSVNYTSEYIKATELTDKDKWSVIPREQYQTEWEKAIEAAPKTNAKKHYMITGMKLPIWDRMGTNGNVWRFIVDGKTVVGKEIHPSELEKVLKSLNAEIDAIKMNASEVFESVMDQNKIIRLSNDWRFRRTKSQAEERMELIGPDRAFHNSFREMGIAIELIDFKTRYFIPTEPATAKTILEKLLKNRPIVEVAERTRNKIFSPDFGEGGYLTSELTPDWKKNLFDKKDYSAATAVQFLAANSPTIEDRTLFQAMLSNPKVLQKLQKLPIAILDYVDMGREAGRAYYDSGDHRIAIDDDYIKSSMERVSGTIVEEVVHGLTHHSMTAQDKRELTAMLNRAIAHLPEKERAGARKSQPRYEHTYLKMAGLTSQGRSVYYSLQNIDEFLAGAIRHPEVRDFLKSIPEMEGIGKPTLWDRFTQWISQIIFGNVENASLLSQVLEKAGELIERQTPTMVDVTAERANRFFAIDDSELPIPMQDNLDALTDRNISHLFASDPGATAWLKQRMGILNIPNTDLGKLEQYLSLPHYLGKKYPVFNDLKNRQTLREKLRSEGVQQFLAASQPFMMLKGDQLSKVEQALIEGDKEKAVYNEDVLIERFGLSPAGIEAYVSVRSSLDIMLTRWSDHAEWALLRPFEKTLTAVEYQTLVGIYKTVLTPNEIAVLPPNIAKAYQRIQPNVNLIKRIRGRIAELKGYFPRYREQGKYYVAVKKVVEDESGNKQEFTTFTTFANSEWEVTKIVKNLEEGKEADETIIYGRHTQELESSFFGVSDQNLQRLIDNSIQTVKQEGNINQEQADNLRNGLSQSLAEMLMRRGAGARMLKRAGRVIGGYETTGLQQVLKNYIVGYMGMETKQDASYDFLEGLSRVPKNQPVLFQEASHYIDTMLRNYDKEDRWFSKIRALAFTYYLAGSIRAAAVQFTQNFVTGIPFLAREMKGMGWLGAEKAYTKAMWDISFGRMTDEEKFMEHELLMGGVTNDQYIRSISREIRGTMGETWSKTFDILAMPFSKMEIWNRRAAALATFRVYRGQGLSFEEAIAKSEDFIYDTHYLMTKANLPHAARGGDIPSKLIGTAYTFRRFTHNYILSMIYSMRGKDGKFHWQNMDVFVRSLAWMAVFAGLSGLPFLDDLLDELEKFFGKPFRKQISDELRAMGGEPLERAGMAGIPALLGQIPGMVGVDLSGSLRLGLPSLMQPGKGAQETVFGVWGGLAKKMTNSWESVGREDYLRAVEFASPAFIENVLKAMRMTTIGGTTPGGKIMFDEKGRPIKETTGEAAAQMLGFRPERIAAVAQTHRGFANIEAKFAGIRDNLYARFRLAKTGEERTAVIRDVQKYNMDAQKYRGAVPMINADSLRKSFTAKPEKRYMAFGSQR